MGRRETKVASSEEVLRRRVSQVLSGGAWERRRCRAGYDLFGRSLSEDVGRRVRVPSSSIHEFLEFLCDAHPGGDVYVFGGMLRDLAFSGRDGFWSDIDLVVDGNWTHLVKYLNHLGIQRNKFGGYRLEVAGWPVDLWMAQDTWAVRMGLVEYRGISTLTETTILNWDGILMDWRTKSVISRVDYFEEIQRRFLEVVLTDNPKPLGACVRAFRQLCLKGALELGREAARYFHRCMSRYSIEEIRAAELTMYGSSHIEANVLVFFRDLDVGSRKSALEEFRGVSSLLQFELI